MSTCERAIEVEDWTLGLLSAGEAADVELHVASCADCQDAKAMFDDERGLFAARAAHDEALPPLVIPKPSLVARLGAGRAVSAIAAIAACGLAVLGGAHAFAADDCAAPAVTTPATVLAPPASDEVLTCKAPLSEKASDSQLFSALIAAPLASQTPKALACMDRATCEQEDDAL